MRERWNLLAQSKPSSKRRPRLSFDLLEDRITPSWGSIPPAVIIPPPNALSITQDGQGNAAGDAAVAATEVDWYKFTAASSGTYVFQATTPSSNLDTVAGLYSSTGGRIAFNDDVSSTIRDSKFSATLIAGRTYYFGVTNYTGTPAGSYSWSLDGPAPSAPPPPTGGGDDTYEQNDTRPTAFNLGTLTSTRSISGLVMADSHDWFRFTTSAAGTASSSVSLSFLHDQGDLDLQLYNSLGNLIRTSDTASNTETISLNGLAAGTYYVHALGFQDAQNPSYSMTILPPGGTTPPPSGSGYDITLITAGMTSAQQAIFEQAAQKWEAVITAALPAANYNGVTTTGVIINASSVAIDGSGGILGQAGPDRFRSGSSLPYHGIMQFDTADLAGLQSSGGLLYTIIHEMGHVLGIGTLWTSKGLLSGASTTNPIFTGSRATAEYNAIFNRTATGVPVENTGGSGTRNAHWRESTFGREIMTGYLNSGVNPMSRVTVASLADMGYTVDMSRADPYNPGSGWAGGGGGSGGGTSLRAEPRVVAPDLRSHLANEAIKASPVKTLIPTPVVTGVRQTATEVKTLPPRSITPVVSAVNQTTINVPAKTADDVFSQLANSRLTKPLAI